jgi:uncharacterized protein (TIGR03792 family)
MSTPCKPPENFTKLQSIFDQARTELPERILEPAISLEVSSSMVIEWLRYHVPTEFQTAFLEADARIWTVTLEAQPGFLSKESWLEPADLQTITLVIRWASLADWKSISAAVLKEADREFVLTLRRKFEMLEARTFEVF